MVRGKSLENEERERKGISSLMHLITDDVLRSDEYRLLAISAQFLAECIKLLEITRSKNKLTTIMKRKTHIGTKIYKIINSLKNTVNISLEEIWEKDLDLEQNIDPDTWTSI